MDYSEDELNYIGSKKPEYKLEPVPSLDFVIVKFLEKYEVYVRPASSRKRTARDVGSSAIAGAIGGMAGADVGGDAFIIKGQEKQTAVQDFMIHFFLNWLVSLLSSSVRRDYKVIQLKT